MWSPSPTKKRFNSKQLFLVLVVFFVLLLSRFVQGVTLTEEKILVVEEGMSVTEISKQLEEEGIVSSSLLFVLQARLSEETIKSGSYQFEEGRHSLRTVWNRLSQGDFGESYIAITIPEGSYRQQIAAILEESELGIDSQAFLDATEGKEGYLFPDTYFFFVGDTVETIVARFEREFAEQIAPFEASIAQSGNTLEEIITMASLLEKEASPDEQEQRIVSGILWKRIEKGMPLQVDAPFLFVLGKTSAQLTITDLQTDGPYNTYTNQGLIPTPIGNPGIQSIEAALNPIDTLYYYYLHDTNGKIHYGVTHDEHVRNKNRYLR